MNPNSPKFVNGVIIAAISAVIFITALTIIGDLYPPLKNLLKEEHYHHWIGKGVWATILFVLVTLGYAVFTKEPQPGMTARLLKLLSWTVIACTFALIFFFVYEFARA